MLRSLKLITDFQDDIRSAAGALLVGNPCVKNILVEGKPLKPLPSAEEEVNMIGDLVNSVPLTGRKATKAEVLIQLSSVALVHIAAHGCVETGEIYLSPDFTSECRNPKKEDYILSMADVSRVKLRAKLVVLSCCYSG